MAGESVVRAKGIGFFGLLTLLFVGLKLGEVGVVANWSWWLVLAPFWVPWTLFVGFFFLVLLGVFITGESLTERKRTK